MNPIRLPRVAAKAKVFAEIETHTHSRTLELRQTPAAAVLTVGDGHQLCRITAPPPEGTAPGEVASFLIDARAFGKAASEVGCGRTEPFTSAAPEHVSSKDRPITVVRIDEKTAGMAGPEGSPQTLKVEPGSMPDADRIFSSIRQEGRLVARVDPRFLQSMADVAVAAGITSIDVTFSPQLNFLATSGSGPDGSTVEVAVAGIGDVQIDNQDRPPWELDSHDPMVFTMPEAKPKKSSRRPKKATGLDLFVDDIPF